MFTRRCTACETRQLVFPSQIVAASATAEGLALSYRCWCGQEQSFETADVARAMPVLAA